MRSPMTNEPGIYTKAQWCFERISQIELQGVLDNLVCMRKFPPTQRRSGLS